MTKSGGNDGGGGGAHKRRFHQTTPPPTDRIKRCRRGLLEVAMNRNTIAVVQDWSSKSIIAAKLIQEFQQHHFIIFLAPSPTLVNQLFVVIKACTDLHVKEMDERLVEQWNEEHWRSEISGCNVLIMTPRVLLGAFRKASISVAEISMLIFDECHYATSGHSYSEIMKEYYHKSVNKPKIFGMTTSPLIRKALSLGMSSSVDCEDHRITELESLLDSQVYGVVGKAELEEFTLSSDICRFYDVAKCFGLGLKDKLDILFSTYDASLRQESSLSQSAYIKDKLKILQKRLSDDHTDILYCLDNLGLHCAYEAVKVCMETVPNPVEDCKLYMETSSPCKSFLGEALTAMTDYSLKGNETVQQSEDGLEEVDMGSISPKFSNLLQIFESLRKDTQVLCLIFVEKTLAATAIVRYLQKVATLSHLTVSYLDGSNSSVDAPTPKMQNEAVESTVRKVNLLFTTDVAREGIVVPNCSYIICFDSPKTVQDYVKCRELARQNDCQLIMMLERNNKKQKDELFEIIRSKQFIHDTSKHDDLDTCISRFSNVQQGDAYVVEHTGASVTVNSSLSLINQYCRKLPGDRYYRPQPTFKLLQSGLSYECKLILPPNAAFQTIVGPPHQNSNTSKKLACLEACKNLHQIGALDDNLLPCIDVQAKNNSEVQSSGPAAAAAAGAGTTKRKELHGTTHIWSLAGSWGGKADSTTFYAYKIVFSCDFDDEIYSSFVLLTESRLDDDVASTKIDLYLLENKVVPSSIVSCGQVCYDMDQIARAMHFHELFFNALYGRIFQGSRSTDDRRFLLENSSELLWNPSYMYLLLPLEIENVLDPELWSINWKAIDSCVAATKFMRSCWSNLRHSESDSRSFAASVHRSSLETNIVYMANTSSHVKDLINTVAFSVHTGKMYTVLGFVADSSADSPFDGKKFSTFSEYYYKKYGIVLVHPKQPLLLLKQCHNPFNLLLDFTREYTSSKGTTTNPYSRVHMPPELLVKIDVPVSALKGSYLLPSVMHRMESLMLASQLRKEIAFDSTEAQIPSALILEALTTLRCCEKFSMERLELLGDSVLKYAVGCHLFLKYPNKHEGQLSSLRSTAVCNATLHKSGTSHKIQEYIRDTAFDPCRWTAPGQLSIHPEICSHGLGNGEVPSDSSTFITFEEDVKVGKSCDNGHRWLCSKTIADCVEALIGAYYVGGGLLAAMHSMQWLGIEVNIEPSSLDNAINAASLHSYTPKSHEIEALEGKLRYEFSVKGLLLEAITHASEQDSTVGYCYQRLEFLGDSVLDLLITLHLYQTYSDIDPGELTDLRSASVNNETFAQVAVRRNLYPHLQTSSEILLNQIEQYRKVILEEGNPDKSMLGQKGPKVLGDLIESITGAILIDTRLNLDEVWKILRPLLSPIATPDTLELPPLRELMELCDSLGYYIKEDFVKNPNMIQVELKLQLKDELLTRQGVDRTKKNARGQAAAHLLKDLQKRGISFAQCVSKRNKQQSPPDGDSTAVTDSAQVPPSKKNKTSQLPVLSSNVKNHVDSPAIDAIEMQKGGPRKTLFELCKKLQWPRPSFEPTENKLRSPIEVGEGPEKRTCSITFESKVSLCIPDFGDVEATGDQRADKKSSLDAAAIALLLELKKQGLLKIGS